VHFTKVVNRGVRQGEWCPALAGEGTGKKGRGGDDIATLLGSNQGSRANTQGGAETGKRNKKEVLGETLPGNETPEMEKIERRQNF